MGTRHSLTHPVVLVVAAGYFVDILDLTLFNMVRVQSLTELGFKGDELISKGMFLLNAQMLGMLLGGFLWGQLADKLGRMKSLFASIILYSVANLLNAFVTSFSAYAFLRLFSGLGLAGELGVGLTLIAEILPTRSRGVGTTFVATIGVLGAVLGGLMVEFIYWRYCYFIGGLSGLLLLLARYKTNESGLFLNIQGNSHVAKGRLLDLFSQADRFKRFLFCVFMGIPIWFIAGVLMPYSPELSDALGVTEPIKASRSIAISYLGLAVGDFLSGYISQVLRSRLRVVLIFQLVLILLVAVFLLTARGSGQNYIYFLFFLIGVAAGFWALFVTIGAEAFGTNLRATAATSIPNLVRGAVIPMTLAVQKINPTFGLVTSVLVVGIVAAILGLIGSMRMPETFALEMDYIER